MSLLPLRVVLPPTISQCIRMYVSRYPSMYECIYLCINFIHVYLVIDMCVLVYVYVSKNKYIMQSIARVHGIERVSYKLVYGTQTTNSSFIVILRLMVAKYNLLGC